MPTYVLRMSTDADITSTTLDPSWNPIAGNHQWAAIQHGGLNIPGGATIIVIAHGNNKEIGNRNPGAVDINAETFLALIHSNMAGGAAPARIFISACAKDIAGFAAGVRLAAENNRIWANTEIYGHTDPVSGAVPRYTPQSLDWTQIF